MLTFPEHPRLAETSCMEWLAGSGPQGSLAQIFALSYSKESLCKEEPKEMTQILVSPGEIQLQEG